MRWGEDRFLCILPGTGFQVWRDKFGTPPARESRAIYDENVILHLYILQPRSRLTLDLAFDYNEAYRMPWASCMHLSY